VHLERLRLTDDPALILERLPVGVALVDAVGTIKAVNERLLEMVGWSAWEVVGRSILEFVIDEDLEFAADSLTAGVAYTDMVMGPVRIRYRDATGRPRYTEFWARNCLDVPGLDGYVVTISEESVVEQLSEAVSSIAQGASLTVTLAHVAAAMEAHPVQAPAAVVMLRGGEIEVIGQWPGGPELAVPVSESRFWSAIADGRAAEFDRLTGLPADLQEAAVVAGFGAAWVRPIPTGDAEVRAALVVWRGRVHPPSPNQQARMREAAASAGLAFSQAAYRTSLEHAAYVDALTGVGNRARLHDILRSSADAPLAVVYVDLDGFKGVNDLHGHDVGDAVLVETALRIARSVRGDDVLIRMGGDEFVIVCRSAMGGDALAGLAARLVETLSESYRVDTANGPLHLVVTASVGAAPADAGEQLQQRIGLADRAMYRAKAAGKNAWYVAYDERRPSA
jgi:diguanylate cyclase (GGDEF)-like protein/PAS domain S-box-containing protein